MCEIQEKLREMNETLKGLKKRPIFFIGSGMSRRYLESPDWEGLLKKISEPLECEYDEVKDKYQDEYEKIGQELEYYCFRNPKVDLGQEKDHRLIFRNIIAEIFRDYCDKFKSEYERNEEQDNDINIQFHRKVNDKLTKVEEEIYSEEQYAKQYEQLADEFKEYSEKYRKKLEIKELAKIKPKAIITTNYDTMLEDFIYNGKVKCHVGQDLFTTSEKKDYNIQNSSDIFSKNSEEQIDLYKIHGCITRPETIVITREDYDDFFKKSKYLYAKILTLFCEYPLIFMGYSISDRNIKDVLTSIVTILSDEQKKEFLKHIWVLGRSEQKDKNNYSEKSIELFNGKEIKVQCFDIYDYSQFFKCINSVTNTPEFDDLKFSISEDVIELLIKPLYEQQDKLKVVTRELLQNALDACKKKEVDANIKIEIRKVQDDMFLEIMDNGIGMDISDIIKNFLTVGKSSKKNSKKGMVGKYGIGILSLYLIGEYAEVYTKKEECTQCAFKLSIKDNNKKQVEWLDENEKFDISDLSNQASYTYIRVKINKEECARFDKISEQQEEKDIKDIILTLLGLNHYLTDKKNNITIVHGNLESEIPKLELNEKFYNDGDIGDKISVYKSKWMQEKESDNNNGDVHYHDNMIFFNNMLSNVSYKWSNAKMLQGEQIPFVVLNIDDLGQREDEFVTTLSRSIVEVSGGIAERIQRAIYTLEIEKVVDEICAYKQKCINNEIDVCEKNQIEKLRKKLMSNCKILGKNADILIRNDKIALAKNNICSHYEVWGYINKINFQKEDKAVLFINLYMNKSSIADFIENGQIIAISIQYLDDYIFEATGSNNGLRIKALKWILKFLGIDDKYLNDDKSIWSYVIGNKKYIRDLYYEKSCNGVLWLENIEKKDMIEFGDSRIVFLERGYINRPIDNMFAEILQNKIYECGLEQFLEII